MVKLEFKYLADVQVGMETGKYCNCLIVIYSNMVIHTPLQLAYKVCLTIYYLVKKNFTALWLLGGESIQSLQINVYVGQSYGSLLHSPQRSWPQERKTGQGAGQ